MTKEDKKSMTTFTYVKNGFIFVSAAIAALIAVYSVLNTVYTHFAKADEVKMLQQSGELLSDRLQLNIIDDTIQAEEDGIHQLESYKIFQKVESPEFTETENKILEEKKERIQELKTKRAKTFEEIEERIKK